MAMSLFAPERQRTICVIQPPPSHPPPSHRLSGNPDLQRSHSMLQIVGYSVLADM